jgi:hypothetical protein
MRKDRRHPTPRASADGHPHRPTLPHDPRRAYREALRRALRELTRGRRA